MKILLEREKVEPDKLDNQDRAPLWYAAWGGDHFDISHEYEEVVKILLRREEVNSNGPDIVGGQK